MASTFIAMPSKSADCERYGNSPLGQTVNYTSLRNVTPPHEHKVLREMIRGEKREIKVAFLSGEKTIPFTVTALND